MATMNNSTSDTPGLARPKGSSSLGGERDAEEALNRASMNNPTSDTPDLAGENIHMAEANNSTSITPGLAGPTGSPSLGGERVAEVALNVAEDNNSSFLGARSEEATLRERTYHHNSGTSSRHGFCYSGAAAAKERSDITLHQSHKDFKAFLLYWTTQGTTSVRLDSMKSALEGDSFWKGLSKKSFDAQLTFWQRAK